MLSCTIKILLSCTGCLHESQEYRNNNWKVPNTFYLQSSGTDAELGGFLVIKARSENSSLLSWRAIYSE